MATSRARLVAETGELLYEIPTSTATLYLDVIVALNVTLSESEYTRVRSALLTSRTKIVLETDLPGLVLIETTLTQVSDAPEELQRCRPA